MNEDMKMEVNTSDDDLNFIKRPAILIHHDSLSDDDSRPVTPPMDQSSLKLNKSLGLITSPNSPPYRKIRNMKIESPRNFVMQRFEQVLTSTPNLSRSVSSGRRSIINSASRIQHSRISHFTESDIKDKQLSPAAFINPFSPNVSLLSQSTTECKTKNSFRSFRKRITFDPDDVNENEVLNEEQDTQVEVKRPRLSDFNIPRYQEEFIEREVIGVGEHGRVMKCLNRLNGIEYAIKRGLKPLTNERLAHNEIYAHGVLEHPNIVRNYSSWTENDYVFMQNEFCNGGSLEEAIKKGPLDERQLRRILEHVAQGLRFIHSNNLAHMDIKPGNILISKGPKVFYKQMFSDVDEFGDDEESAEETIYKIADLGHVTKLDEIVDVEEGDCRYLPKELLNTFSDLSKVDIFALGLTLYEAAGGGPLPKNGDDWHNIRDGKLKQLPLISSQFTNLIKRMIHSDAERRPSASELLTETISSPIYKTVKDKHELKAAKHKIQLLEQRLESVYNCMKVIRSQQDPKRTVTHNNNKGERLIGKKPKRSQSASNF